MQRSQIIMPINIMILYFNCLSLICCLMLFTPGMLRLKHLFTLQRNAASVHKWFKTGNNRLIVLKY